MRFHEIILERGFPKAGQTPPGIVDLRDPSASPLDWQDKPRYTAICLTKDGGAITYFYGSANTIPWPDVMAKVRAERDPKFALIGQDFGLRTFQDGILVARDREFAQWDGNRNRYSSDLKPIVQALVDRGLAKPATPIFIGGPRDDDAEKIGTASSILKASDIPTSLVLYHGTSSARMSIIEKDGLVPMDFENRVWNNTSLDKKRPEHREVAVYLTASKAQAEYYARKAVSIDRKRLGPEARRKANNTVRSCTARLQELRAQFERYQAMTPEERQATDDHAARYSYGRHETVEQKIRYLIPNQIARMQKEIEEHKFAASVRQDGPIKPVVLQVKLSKREYAKLMADDDHLRANPDTAPEDWHTSLSHFGQIAYKGSIPASRLTVVESVDPGSSPEA